MDNLGLFFLDLLHLTTTLISHFQGFKFRFRCFNRTLPYSNDYKTFSLNLTTMVVQLQSGL